MTLTPQVLSEYLMDLNLGGLRYFPVVESTNDLALDWASAGAKDWSLVVADAQTKGRGRGDRHWVTKPGTSLAISLVLRPSASERAVVTRFTALAALSLVRALSGWGLAAKIKWPNDVLIADKKVAGILVEVDWQGDQINALVVGIGVNVGIDSLPDSKDLRYPATSIEMALGQPLDRWVVLKSMLVEMMNLRSQIASDDFIKAWNHVLAFQGSWVKFQQQGRDLQKMKLLGVQENGELLVEQTDGMIQSFAEGEIILKVWN